MGFLQIYEDLPDPVQFLKDPKPELIPERVDVKFAFMSRIQGMINEDNADNAMKFVDMLPLEYSSLFVSWCVAEAEAKAKKEGKRDLSQISHPLLNTTGFRDFAMKNHHIITYGVSR